MPRTLSTSVLAAIAASQVSPVLFAVVAFADNTYYLFGGIGTLTPAGPASNPLSTFPYGETFTGLGWLVKLSSIPATNKVQAQNITLALSGIPSTLVSEAINQVRITGTATIFLGFYNSSGALLEDPIQVFAGGLDVPTLSDGGDTCTLSITCENPLLSLNLAPNRRFDDADQQIYHPGDLGLSFVDALAGLQLFWPAPANSGTPYPVLLTLAPNGSAVAVGSTQQITATLHFSDGSNFTVPPYTGSATSMIFASTNPSVASVDNTGLVTGRSEGECSIMARSTYYVSGGAPSGQYRAACGIAVYA